VEQFTAACDDFIAKPVGVGELLEKLKTQLQLEWIEEATEAAISSPELPSGETGKPEKRPPQAIVDDILEQAERGDFTRLEKILDRLEDEDEEYKGFCDRMQTYVKQFDDDSIIDYLGQGGIG
jgi:DNA-binding response OmpR family regulator